MNIDQFVHDTIEVTQFILRRLKQTHLYLVGHSWGTMIGMLAVHRAPHLYKRYFGVAQVVDVVASEKMSYKTVLEKAKYSNDEKAYKDLQKIGPPPWDNLKHDRIHQKYVEAFGGGITRDGKMVHTIFKHLLTSKEYTLFDCIRFFRGLFFSMKHLQDEMVQIDLGKHIHQVDVPINFLMGRHDLTICYEPTETFFTNIKAPEKKWIWFEQSAHTPMMEEPEKFQATLTKEIGRDI